MSALTYTTREMSWANGYYSQAIGYTITGITVNVEGGDVWVSLDCSKTESDGTVSRIALEISQDPEGNGPGFLFGLPSFQLPTA